MPEGFVLKLIDITHAYKIGGRSINVLKGVTLTVRKGEMVALTGPSGAGKSTLLHIAGLLERPTTGKVEILGKECQHTSNFEQTLTRQAHIGFIYQFHHLLPEFSALENVMLPLLIAGVSRTKAREKALELLESVGLSHRLGHRPSALSGGEQQRVAIARAVANSPRLILADEPTGNLDSRSSEEAFNLLKRFVKDHQMSAIIATHDHALALQLDRSITLVDGVLKDAKA